MSSLTLTTVRELYFWFIPTMLLTWLGAKYWIKTQAIPVSDGILLKKQLKVSNPLAEDPTPAIEYSAPLTRTDLVTEIPSIFEDLLSMPTF
jgi:hypothetical protein